MCVIWISKNVGFKLLDPARNIEKEATIKELIDGDLGCGKRDLI